ncbi:MAG: hypothetical protein ACYTGX_17810 [Planctomycetota bacterium]
MRRLLWSVAGALACFALPVSAQDAAPSRTELSEAEGRALDLALTAAGLTRADLRFGKQVFPTKAPLPAVQQALGDPLAARRRLFAQAHQANPTAAWAAAFAKARHEFVVVEGPAQLPEAPAEAQMARLRIASPFLTRRERRDIKRLPPPLLAMVGEWSRLLARPPEAGERSVPGAIADALRSVRPNELPMIRSWGLRHTLAPDEAFNGFQPRRMAPAEGVMSNQSGFGHPQVAVLDALARVDRDAMAAAADRVMHFAAQAGRAARVAGAPPTHPDPLGLVSGGIVARIATRYGDLVIGGTGDNRYLHGSAQFIIDLGGDDTYAGSLGGVDGTAGRPVALLVDCEGDDVYEAEAPFSFGGALLGVAVCADLGGDDSYRGTLVTQGAAVAGCGVLYDAEGTDRYVGERFAQGAALGGVGLLRDDGTGADRYRVVTFGQGFGRTAAVGVLADAGGDDTYTGGGEYPYLPQAPEHSYSHCQGYGSGQRHLSRLHALAGRRHLVRPRRPGRPGRQRHLRSGLQLPGRRGPHRRRDAARRRWRRPLHTGERPRSRGDGAGLRARLRRGAAPRSRRQRSIRGARRRTGGRLHPGVGALHRPRRGRHLPRRGRPPAGVRPAQSPTAVAGGVRRCRRQRHLHHRPRGRGHLGVGRHRRGL